MANLTDYAETDILDFLFRGTGRYSTKSFALFTSGANLEADPSTPGVFPDELVAGSSAGYARVNYSGDLPFAAASGGTMTTDTNITFPQNTSTSVDWQTATHWGLIVNIGGTDRLIVWGAFVTPVASPPYHAVMIKIGDLTIEAL